MTTQDVIELMIEELAPMYDALENCRRVDALIEMDEDLIILEYAINPPDMYAEPDVDDLEQNWSGRHYEGPRQKALEREADRLLGLKKAA
jgi:hypothetical protein